MHISWQGLSCIKLQTKDALVLVNPFQDSVGITMPKLKVEIVASTDMANEQCNNIDRLQGEPFQALCPGEFEVKNVFLYGIRHSATQQLFIIESEGMTLGHPGTQPMTLTQEQLEQFENVDVLFLPISSEGGSAKIYTEMVSQIEPRVIIPIQYATPGVKVALNAVDGFLKEMGVKNTTPEKKIILKQKDLPVEETQILLLSPA